MEKEKRNPKSCLTTSNLHESIKLAKESTRTILNLEVQREFYPYTKRYLNKGDPCAQDLAERPDHDHANVIFVIFSRPGGDH